MIIDHRGAPLRACNLWLLVLRMFKIDLSNGAQNHMLDIAVAMSIMGIISGKKSSKNIKPLTCSLTQ